MIYSGKNFLIAGVSASGLSAGRLLLGRGANVFLYDQSPNAELKKLCDSGAVDISNYSAEKTDNILKQIYLVIKSPGVPPEISIIDRAVCRGLPVISEIELGWYNYKGTVLAITGTNGKSTVTSLVSEIVNQAGHKCNLCGNIGTPFTKYCGDGFNSFCAVEISSFQLENCYEFKPHISAVLNIAQDHLNRHHSMKNYINAKKRILKNQRKTEYTVLNFDCYNTRQFFENAESEIFWFSGRQKVKGAYIENGNIMFCGEKILHTDELKLIGEHNILNALAAVCFGKILDIKNDDIAKAVSGFKGIAHRLNIAAVKGGVTFYNDSKSTNAHSTLTAVKAMTQKTVLLLGGSDKNENLKPFFKELKKYRKIWHCVLFGQAKERFASEARACGYNDFSLCEGGMQSAVTEAYQICKGEGAVLLSPACASYDEFDNFERRGEKFIQIVNNL
jgi:UDP-N-acetylmuramoylalanine--D-glutamate ligase